MDMFMTSTAGMTALTPSPTSTAAMSKTSGMSMGMDMGSGSCKISMLWNWYTIDACFLSRTWHVRSAGAFAGSCIGVILLVISLELLRRAQREFDRYLLRTPGSQQVRESDSTTRDEDSDRGLAKSIPTFSVQPASVVDHKARLKLWHQIVRSFLYMMQFAVGYFVMLLAMYYNGYIILMIFVGAFFGAFIFQWDTFGSST